jgi:hypothetical protein
MVWPLVLIWCRLEGIKGVCYFGMIHPKC